MDYYVKGKVTDKTGKVRTDYCLKDPKYPNNDEVRKYYCTPDGFAAIIDYQCPAQCMDGACTKHRIAGY